MKERHAIIEIGARGIRLLVADASPHGIENIIYSTGDLSNLGKDADSLGNLSSSSIKRVSNIANRYYNLAKENGADNILAVATEVVRSAPNKTDLQQAIAPLMPFKIITKEEEAAFSFVASVNVFQHQLTADSRILVIDQGGSSTELTTGSYDKNGEFVLQGISNLDLGTVALSKLFVNAFYLKQGFDAVRETVREELRCTAPFPMLQTSPPSLTIGLGSAIMIFARGITNQKEGREPRLKDLHGQSVSTRLIGQKIAETEPSLSGLRKSDFGSELTPDSDLATLVSGILTYHEISQLYNVSQIRISRHGMRYGALLWQAGKRCQINLEGQPSSPKAAGHLVNINSATPEQLANLSKVSPTIAANIVRFRDLHGDFRTVDELIQVKGVGAKTVQGIRDQITT